MNFDLSEDQKLLVDTAASFVKKQSPVTRMRKLRDDAVGWEKHTWRQMGEFGWLGVALPESVGGLGGSFVDAGLILEQLGTTLVPEPVIPSLVAASAIVRDKNARQWIAPMIEGKTSLAVAFTGSLRAKPKEGRLSGELRWVLNGHAADHIVVATGPSVWVIDRGAAGMTVKTVKTMDGRRAAMISLEDTPATEVDGDPAYALDVGAACACAEGVGITRTVLHMTCDYLRTREQFGVKIGTFQALQHRAVDMFVETELCRSTAILAMLRISSEDANERKSAISAAKVQLAVGGRYVTQQAIQLHGGIGITDEADVGLYFKRMHILNTLFGDEEFHVARFHQLPTFTANLTT